MTRRQRWLGSAALALVVIAAAAIAFFSWPAPLPDVQAARQNNPASARSIERGEYLARAADCYVGRAWKRSVCWHEALRSELPIIDGKAKI